MMPSAAVAAAVQGLQLSSSSLSAAAGPQPHRVSTPTAVILPRVCAAVPILMSHVGQFYNAHYTSVHVGAGKNLDFTPKIGF